VPWLASWPALALGGAALMLGFHQLSRIRGTIVFLAATVVLLLAYSLISWWACLAAFRNGRLVNIEPWLVLGTLAWAVTFAVRWLATRRILSVVKSPEIVRLLDTAGNDFLGLKGEERVVTVMFADIRGFTDYSEQHSANEVVAMLNAYYTEIVPLIQSHKGTLVQYMGDGIMVLFGAPLYSENHALEAVETAVALVRRVRELKETWSQFDFPAFRIGVGIHTGPAIVGTVGSPGRLDYTANGDVVNTAARIESENKVRGTEILISAVTYRALSRAQRDRLGCEQEASPAQVKGKREPLSLHAVRVSDEAGNLTAGTGQHTVASPAAIERRGEV
jgi:adenylate cyclase